MTDPAGRDLLEHELWLYRKLNASVGRYERVNALVSVHRWLTLPAAGLLAALLLYPLVLRELNVWHSPRRPSLVSVTTPSMVYWLTKTA